MQGEQKMDMRGAGNGRWVRIHLGDRRQDGAVKEAEGRQKVVNKTIHQKPQGDKGRQEGSQ